jgi:lysylphosphatidylglycerol synthetase-like protein (DUF2156 family)
MPIHVIQGERAHLLTNRGRVELLSPFLMQYGDGCLSYSALQAGMEYFIQDDLGCLAFSKPRSQFWSKSAFVLADPIAPPEARGLLIDRFLETFRKAVFLQVDSHTASLLAERGFSCAPMGVETEIEMRSFDLRGRRKQILRTACNWASKLSLRLVEHQPEDQFDSLYEVSGEWLSSRRLNDAEIWFFARPALFTAEVGVRKFSAHEPNGRCLGFVFFDPMFRDGSIVGYAANVSRFRNECRQGIIDFIIIEAIQKFRQESVERLSLGLSPFHGIGDAIRHGENWWLKKSFQLLYRHGNRVYNFRNLGFHKSRYDGSQKLVYFCSNSPIPVADIYLSMKNARMLRSLWELVRKSLSLRRHEKSRNPGRNQGAGYQY